MTDYKLLYEAAKEILTQAYDTVVEHGEDMDHLNFVGILEEGLEKLDELESEDAEQPSRD